MIHTENDKGNVKKEDILKYEATMTEDGVTVQRTLFVNQLMEESERDKAIRAGLESMNLAEARAEILRLQEREAKWIERILEEAKREGKKGSDLSTYIMTMMNNPDEGQLDLKKRETVLLNMIVLMTAEADKEIHKETAKARQVTLLIDTYGLRLLTRARFPKERVQYMENRGLIIRDKRPLLEPKRKPQDLYMMEPTVIPINSNATLDLIHKLYEDIVEAIKARGHEEPSKAREEALVLPFGETAQILIPRVKSPGDSIFPAGLYAGAYLKGENGEDDRVLELDFRDGALYASKETKEPIVELRRVGTYEKVYDLDFGLLHAIYSVCLNRGERIEGRYVIKLSRLIESMGKSGRGVNRKQVLEGIKNLQTAFTSIPQRPGVKDNFSYFQLFSSSYIQDSDLLLVTMDFFDLYNGIISKSYLEMKKKRASKTIKGEIDEKIAKLKPGETSREGHHSLAKMSLTSVRNKAAYYVVLSILDLISAAGVSVPRKKPKPVHKTFKDLIEGNTVLSHRLDKAKTDESRNTILRRTFEDAFEYLREHTRIYQYYKDLHIEEKMMIPSMTDLKKGTSFRCTHKGKSEILPEIPSESPVAVE